MIEFIIGSFIYAKYKKNYKLKYIFKYPYIFAIVPPLICAILYIYLEICVWNQNYWFFPYQHIIKTITLLSYIPLIYVHNLYYNDTYENNILKSFLTSPASKATFCLGLGSFLNYIALVCNNMKMPIFPSNCYWTGYFKPKFINDGLHVLGNAYTKAIPLCDWIDLGAYCASPGDMLARLFPFIIIYYSVKNLNKIFNKMIK